MVLNSSTKLSIAELAIYVVLLQPTVWLAYKHGGAAILPFFYLSAFEILRIVTGGIQISDRNDVRPSTAGVIVSSIGLSPLLLAYGSFLNEIWRRYATSNLSQLASLISQAGVHVGAVAGIALVAVGASKLADENSTSDISTGHTMLEAGAVVLLVTWLALVLLCLQLFSKLKHHLNLALLMVSACAFIGVRAIYTVVYAFDHSPSLSPITGKFVVKLILVFLVQLLAALSLLAVAFLTRNTAKQHAPRSDRRGDVESRNTSVPLTSRGPN